MKKIALLLFFVIPQLMYASFETYACNKSLERIDAAWLTHNALLMQFEALPKSEKMQGVPLLKEAIESCQRAIGHCDYILGKIEHKSKRERQQHYWTHVKEECKQYKAAISQQIDHLNGMIMNVFAEATVAKANILLQKAAEKGDLADKMRKEHPHSLDSTENGIAMLNHAIKLYEEAGSFLADALDTIAQYPLEEAKKTIQETMNAYRKAIDECHKEIVEWPVTALELKQ